MSTCRSCGRRITWATTTATGKRMPVDPDPIDGGNIVLVSGNDGPEARVLTRDELARRDPSQRRLHVSHFTTCPKASEHRR